MPKLKRSLGRSAGPWATAVAVWKIWHKIPPKHRKRLVAQARKHGPRLVKQAYMAKKKSGGLF
jgi:hypothetical protein